MRYCNLAIAALAAVSTFTTINAKKTKCKVQIRVSRPEDFENIPSDFNHRGVECELPNGDWVPLQATEFQELEMYRLVAEGNLHPNHSIIKFNSGNNGDRADDGGISLPTDATIASLITNGDQPMPRQGDQFGDTQTLVIKVIDSTGASVTETLQQLSEKMWGPESLDSVNSRNQFAACSHGLLDFRPGDKPTGDWPSNAPGVIEVTIDIPFNGSSQESLRSAATAKANEQLGVSLPGPFEYVMYAFKDCYGAGCGWAAYAYLSSWNSVYVKNYITFPAVVIHELGHNFGLHHSGKDLATYTDHTCLMGNPLWGDDLAKMCYNAPKSWQIGWYDESNDKVDFQPVADSSNPNPNSQWSGKLVGVTDYSNANRDGRAVIVRVESNSSVDLYVNFNRAIGMTSQMKMAPDKVCVYEQAGNGGGPNVSKIIGQLSQGNMYTQSNFGGSGKTLTITVNEINLTSDPGYATVNICLGACGPTTSPSPTISPTLYPTIAPTTTYLPTAAPIEIPGIDFLGCFKDSENRALPVYKGSSKTLEVCQELCSAYNYFGRQYTNECWCGNDGYDKHGPSNECTCDSPSFLGSWLNCVYKYEGSPTKPPVGPPTKPQSCREGKTKLSIDVRVGGSGESLSIALRRKTQDGLWNKRKSISEDGLQSDATSMFTRCLSNIKCYKFAIKDKDQNGIKDGGYSIFLGADDDKILIHESPFNKGKKETFKFCVE